MKMKQTNLRIMIGLRWVAVLAVTLLLGACRGSESGEPPVHINPNMDQQEKYDPQEPNSFFADGRAMRHPVPGTVARGFLKEDTAFHFGRDESGAFVTGTPVVATSELLARGQDRYEIFCAVCHGSAGDGNGIIMTGGYGYVPAPTYHSDNLRAVSDGYLYSVIANGVRTMPGYAQQIPVADRWAITAYIRALQRSQHAGAGDVDGAIQNLQSAGASSSK
jgi:mono/diheme cytochrome c family protein